MLNFLLEQGADLYALNNVSETKDTEKIVCKSKILRYFVLASNFYHFLLSFFLGREHSIFIGTEWNKSGTD